MTFKRVTYILFFQAHGNTHTHRASHASQKEECMTIDQPIKTRDKETSFKPALLSEIFHGEEFRSRFLKGCVHYILLLSKLIKYITEYRI